MRPAPWLFFLLLCGAPAAEAGAIYFTDQVVAETATPGCGSFIPTYAATLSTPAGEEGGKVVPSFSAGGLGCPATISWTADRAFAFSGDTSARLFVGCDAAGVLQGAQVDWRHNGETVTEGNSVVFLTDPPTCTGPADVTELVIPVGSDDVAVAVGDTIEVDVILFEYLPNAPYNPEAHVANRHVKVNSTAHPSGLYNAGIPDPAGGAGNATVVREDLTGAEARVAHRFASPTDSTYELAWPTDQGELTLSLVAAVANGSVSVHVRDAAGDTVFEATADEDTSLEEPVEGEPGTWSITLAYAGFTGNVTLSLAPAAAGGTTSSTTTSARPVTSSNDDTRSGTFPASREKDTPMPGAVPLAVALLAAALVLVRRRL